jgi:hypothetical protein
MDYLLAALQVATNIDTAGVVEKATNPAKIGECITAARVAALTEWMNK